MRAEKVQASLRICAVSPEPSLLAHTSSESRGTFRQKARSLAPLNGWACAVKICHGAMLEDTNSLDGAHILLQYYYNGNTGQFLYWDAEQSTYLPAPTDQTGSEGGKDDKKEGKDKKEKVKVAKKIAKV